MSTGKQWSRMPDSGGRKIPESVKISTEKRIRDYLETEFAGHFTRLDIRFRNQFCYVDAYTEPDLTPGWPPADWPESREEYVERLRNTPTHLCRLRYFGDMEHWGFAFYTYSHERYELSIFPTGQFYGPPEPAVHVSAAAYL